uniref:Uncharacterized protein n=1 Tax=Dunaliella tertiolecta TaxID=3047 RepID=A0A7S3R7G2_DUNTE|mmetsp:Transcript_15105/g.40874  ORF Transcript_15105/g.40874 Transcript_15105/m.40874 type:complete len:411 (-) Transcript_15105:620-1852(-)|eukprot:CAMPEP_0202353508 /NCGR_PEP_ID=MMETSP1126-20121109/9239_1 /ASSEMBLY_ACC=CAM_ASM_000457 /TAXON_ID=3047 /ORGANISM="Dunaliella tertiolecta, Strain CCMP1320" /LENGTH=410 /DNA_ID=CAMNT_0048945867 /DNA_START=10 /DNA_END=1242 /DNA_ORIENTATION=+
MASTSRASRLQNTTNEEGRKGSIIAGQYARGERVVKEEIGTVDVYPANEEIAKAVQQKVAAAVEMARKYRHVGWYASFVAAYIIILYFQASAYKSGDVVQTLKKAFLPEDGSTSMTFKSGDELLDYLGTKVLLPIWQDPVCGDGTCQQPWEFPAWGRFGCRADCGVNLNTTTISLSINADFTRHPSISARTLMSAARYNLCLKDEARRNRGEADLCWFAEDMTFSDTQPQNLHRAEVINGEWYVSVKGDFTGRVEGKVHDISAASRSSSDVTLSPSSLDLTTLDLGEGPITSSKVKKQQAQESGISFGTLNENENNSTNKPVELKLEPEFKACKTEAETQSSSISASSSPAVRRLLEINKKAREIGGTKGLKMLEVAIKDAKRLLQKQRKALEEQNSKLSGDKKSSKRGT